MLGEGSRVVKAGWANERRFGWPSFPNWRQRVKRKAFQRQEGRGR